MIDQWLIALLIVAVLLTGTLLSWWGDAGKTFGGKPRAALIGRYMEMPGGRVRASAWIGTREPVSLTFASSGSGKTQRLNTSLLPSRHLSPALVRLRLVDWF